MILTLQTGLLTGEPSELERGPEFNSSEFLPPAHCLQIVARKGRCFKQRHLEGWGLGRLHPALESLEDASLRSY